MNASITKAVLFAGLLLAAASFGQEEALLKKRVGDLRICAGHLSAQIEELSRQMEISILADIGKAEVAQRPAFVFPGGAAGDAIEALLPKADYKWRSDGGIFIIVEPINPQLKLSAYFSRKFSKDLRLEKSEQGHAILSLGTLIRAWIDTHDERQEREIEFLEYLKVSPAMKDGGIEVEGGKAPGDMITGLKRWVSSEGVIRAVILKRSRYSPKFSLQKLQEAGLIDDASKVVLSPKERIECEISQFNPEISKLSTSKLAEKIATTGQAKIGRDHPDSVAELYRRMAEDAGAAIKSLEEAKFVQTAPSIYLRLLLPRFVSWQRKPCTKWLLAEFERGDHDVKLKIMKSEGLLQPPPGNEECLALYKNIAASNDIELKQDASEALIWFSHQSQK